MLPDALPMLTSCFLFSFVWQWTDSLYTTLFLNNYKMISLALNRLTANFTHYYTMANSAGGGSGVVVVNPPFAYIQAVNATGTLLFLAPLILLYLVAQRTFVESLSQTGIKM
jgi:multiple sugar transport system permease protein